MKQKRTVYGLFSAVSLALFIGCGGSDSGMVQTKQPVKENSKTVETQNGGVVQVRSSHKVRVCLSYQDNQPVTETTIWHPI